MLEWYVEYRKYRDLIFKRISNIELKELATISLKDGNKEIGTAFNSVVESINFIKKHSTDEVISCIFENKKKSVKSLIENWDKFVKYKNLTLFFINQNSLTEKKWIIKPYIHNKITEKSALKTGIISMSSTVDYS